MSSKQSSTGHTASSSDQTALAIKSEKNNIWARERRRREAAHIRELKTKISKLSSQETALQSDNERLEAELASIEAMNDHLRASDSQESSAKEGSTDQV
ncbi:hypothetical protein L486_00765 [Kwoniella mangroviensis CBS 10435]|uniref:BZIP domain-containing protein n=1 Tax=Kwoniella mangroviensis CBS 10435 TaxID=1331196 RepID=A0A1B9J010_9TREE|nr:uncharacterized protein I203_04298 [Kwoniella mangroviensis CBS 8507]OCF61121.1 hypothetical protein L486_00765 [Kwoniella mangroviensis CBS 10435]OCF66722.1 hypothetical protein I203_04298 [Kwoniella mangroviensis CBS 8507]